MNFASDNAYGVSEKIMAALGRANKGAVSSYGADDLSKAVEARFSEIFEREVAVFQVVTGTAANALSVATFTPPYGALFCHHESHLNSDECGAPEFYSGGAKLVALAGSGAKIAPDTLADALARLPAGIEHFVQPVMLSLTQATELGTVYSVSEIEALSAVARERKLVVHMDGARFANALVGLNVSPAAMTWKAGVDVLSFGATKNGAMAAEAVILFDKAKQDELMFRRKRGGHLISKSRFVAAQLLAYLEDDLWLDLARRANQLARKLADGLAGSGKARLELPVQANELFPVLAGSAHKALQAAGAIYHEWPPAVGSGLNGGEIRVRMVTSFDTPEVDIDRAIGIVKKA